MRQTVSLPVYNSLNCFRASCPEELAQGFEAIKNMKGDGSATDAAKQLEGFVQTLEQHSDLLSDDLKSKLPELMKVAEDLEKKAEDVASKTSN